MGSELVDFDLGHGSLVAGADEAGRGCLAGPIVAAGVRIDYDRLTADDRSVLAELDDSKKLTPDRREEMFNEITRLASAAAVIVRSSSYIDDFGLHRTNLHCLGTALARVSRPGVVMFSDGYVPMGLREPCEALIRGDGTSATVAAASIVAKVSRDRFMHRIAPQYGDWGFEEHVGYSTPSHREAISRLGLTPFHRRSFASVAYEQLELELIA